MEEETGEGDAIFGVPYNPKTDISPTMEKPVSLTIIGRN
jgi:hypothetical protein